MFTGTYLLAEVPIRIDSLYEEVQQMCAPYHTTLSPAVQVSTTPEEIAQESLLSDRQRQAEGFASERIFSTGFFRSMMKNFTAKPVRNADNTVPSRVPIIFISNKISDSITESVTHEISNITLTLPKFLLRVSDIAFTSASPEFMITLAITASEIPNPSMIIPVKTHSGHTGPLHDGRYLQVTEFLVLHQKNDGLTDTHSCEFCLLSRSEIDDHCTLSSFMIAYPAFIPGIQTFNEQFPSSSLAQILVL